MLACPMYTLDVGHLPELRAKYGDCVVAEGFRYPERSKPSVKFKVKKKYQGEQ